MPNHYHLLVYLQTDNPGAAFMQPLLVSYTKAVNRQQGRTGSLFQGRYQAAHVDRDEYLRHLSRYIHLNPVLAGLVATPDEWAFSSYRDFIGLRAGTLPMPGNVLGHFRSRAAYREFVESYKPADRRLIERFLMDD
jgi:hypothetical protein